MVKVQFYKGAKSGYNATSMPGVIYYATDTQEILVDNVTYGSNITGATFASTTDGGLLTIQSPAGDKTVTVTLVTQDNNGLMSAADKKKLDGIAISSTGSDTEFLNEKGSFVSLTTDSSTIASTYDNTKNGISADDSGVYPSVTSDDNVTSAIAKLETKITDLYGKSGDQTNAIAGLNLTQVSADAAFIGAVSQSNGQLAASTKTLTSTNKTVTVTGSSQSINVEANVDGSTVYAGSEGVLSAETYNGSNAIAVSTATNHVKTVSLTLDTDENNLLTQSTTGLKTTLTINHDNNQIQLVGPNNKVISYISDSDFVKDGMLSEAVLVTNPEGQTAGTYIKLTWNTDAGKSDPMYVDVTSLIDVYTAGNGINISEANEVSVVVADGDGYLTSSADGLHVDGLSEAIKGAKTAITTIDKPANAVASNDHLIITKTTGTDGNDVYTIQGYDIASAQALTDLDGDAVKDSDLDAFAKTIKINDVNDSSATSEGVSITIGGGDIKTSAAVSGTAPTSATATSAVATTTIAQGTTLDSAITTLLNNDALLEYLLTWHEVN